MRNLTDSRLWECFQLILSWADEADKEAAAKLEFAGPGVTTADSHPVEAEQRLDSNAVLAIRQTVTPLNPTGGNEK